MPRIRTIKPEFWTSESIGRLPRDARLLFIAMWSLADDSGRLRGSLAYLSGAVFPYDDDARSLIVEWVDMLRHEGMIRTYIAPDGNSYIDIPKWKKHQKIDKPSESKIPPFDESYPNARGIVAEDSPLDQGSGKGKEGKGEESPLPPKGGRKKPTPTPESECVSRHAFKLKGNVNEKKAALRAAIEKHGIEAVDAADFTGIWPSDVEEHMAGAVETCPHPHGTTAWMDWYAARGTVS